MLGLSVMSGVNMLCWACLLCQVLTCCVGCVCYVSGVNMLCWAGVTYSLVSLDPFSLLGIKPLVEKLLRRYNYTIITHG